MPKIKKPPQRDITTVWPMEHKMHLFCLPFFAPPTLCCTSKLSVTMIYSPPFNPTLHHTLPTTSPNSATTTPYLQTNHKMTAKTGSLLAIHAKPQPISSVSNNTNLPTSWTPHLFSHCPDLTINELPQLE
jgi:hypothetical protein